MPIITLPDQLPADYDREQFMLIARNLGTKMFMFYGTSEKYVVIIESIKVRRDGKIAAHMYYVSAFDHENREEEGNLRYTRLHDFSLHRYRLEEMT